MTLKNINLANSYDSDDVDVTKSFFEPLLRESVIYKRVAAYFSSTSFRALSEGLSTFVWNNGRMFLIIAQLINEEDYKAILQGKTSSEDVISSIFIRDRDDLLALTRDENVRALAYLLATNRLKMKFVLSAKLQSIFHLKFGIFIDDQGNKVSFSGSINETLAAYSTNIEEFKVFRNWVIEENKYLATDEKKFDSIFAGEIRRGSYVVVDLPNRVKNVITELSEPSEYGRPRNIEERIELRDYQRRAIDKWVDSSYTGIVQMATGTGKTIVAVECIKRVLNSTFNRPLLVIIGAPTLGLIDQWHDVLSKHFESNRVLTTSIGKQSLYSRLSMISEGSRGYYFLLGTYASLCKDWFTTEILDSENYGILFVADEAHWLGAPELSKSMQEKYSYRLGLTATPIRHFDVEGTEKIMQYFGSVVFNFSIKDAIDGGYLTPYEYYVHLANLGQDELKEYIRLTRNLTRVKNSSRGDEVTNKSKLSIILSMRARIIKKAKDKFRVLGEILDSLSRSGKLKNLIIYFEDSEQIENFMTIVYPHFDSKLFRIIDAKTGTETRNAIIRDFSDGSVNCVVCMKILDEGLDIPSAERAIFVSSSTNPKQFIQRRGRILRVKAGKKFAEVFDIFVSIDENQLNDITLKNIDRKISVAELKRICTFGVNSFNRSRFLKDLENIGKKTNINVWEILGGIEDDG